MESFSLDDLERIVAARAVTSPEESYTARLLASGLPRVTRKFGEEAVEATVAALSGSDGELTAEAADVLFHLLVLLRARGIPLAAVTAELQRRTAQGGLAEKAARAGAV